MSAAAILAVIFSGIVSIIFVVGLVKRLNRRPELADDDRMDEVLQRLADVERRLTDTQDVMIALSDKLDHWEQESPRSVVGSTGNV
jgi:hypothetical protein